jgi:Fe-S-cluster containining protein
MPEPRANDAAVSAVLHLYDEVDAEIARAGWTCMGGGTCCRFDRMGHRLYLTTLERDVLLAAEATPAWSRARRGRCPYQRHNRCEARRHRPLGCRTYFCRAASEASDGLYERFHARLGRLHERFALAYRYTELTGALLEAHSAASGQRIALTATSAPPSMTIEAGLRGPARNTEQ